MRKNSPAKTKTSLKKKAALIILGSFLSFVLLETGLSLGGFVLLSLQEYKNRQTLKQKDTYHIMCLGESTTIGQYPHFLETILNQRDIGMKFSVIDKGIPATNTTVILGVLESYIDKYHPNMVIAMMGVNDNGKHIPPEIVTNSKSIRLLSSLRTYKLARLLWLHIQTLAQEKGILKPYKKGRPSKGIPPGLPSVALKKTAKGVIARENLLKDAINQNPLDIHAHIMLGKFYKNQGNFVLAETLLKKAIKLSSKSSWAHYELGRLYKIQYKLSPAEASFKKCIDLNPRDGGPYILLSRVYRAQGLFPKAEGILKQAMLMDPQNYRLYVELARHYISQRIFDPAESLLKEAIKLNPQYSDTYLELGRAYQDQGKFPLAEESIKEAIRVNPQHELAYHNLGYLYCLQDKFSKAEDSYRQVLKLNPQIDWAYLGLGIVYKKRGEFSQAIDSFKQVISLNPQHAFAYGELLSLHEEIGQPELAKEYTKKLLELVPDYYDIQTVNNFLKLKKILDEYGIRLVVVQYPMRSMGPLKIIFKNNEKGVIFVDNESTFKDAVNKDGHWAYFEDMFGGNFGHCTDRGNRLLAENIADVIIKEAFNK